MVTVAMLAGVLTLSGCGHTLEQIQKVAHDAIDTAGKVYQDVKDNVDTAKKTLSGQ